MEERRGSHHAARSRPSDPTSPAAVFALLDASPNPVVATDATGRIAYLNAKVETTFGYARDELLGRPVEVLVPTHAAARHARRRDGFHAHPVARPAGIGLDLSGRRKDGSEFPVEVSLAPVDTPAGPHVLATVVDITARKVAESQLLQAQKLESVGRLAGGIAHDFNNVLFAIKGYAELLAEDLAPQRRAALDPDEALRSVQAITVAATRAASLTAQLLAFSRQQIVHPEVFDLNDAVEAVEPMLRPLMGDRIQLAVRLNPAAGRVLLAQGQLDQILVNLVINARDAMPDGGTITIESGNVELDAAYVSQHLDVLPGPYVYLAVSDTGQGMDVETRDHAFEPFYTTKELGKGTGLGLATIYGIMQQAGGQVWLYSEPGMGSSFKLYFPRIDAPVAGAHPALAPRAEGCRWDTHAGRGRIVGSRDGHHRPPPGRLRGPPLQRRRAGHAAPRRARRVDRRAGHRRDHARHVRDRPRRAGPRSLPDRRRRDAVRLHGRDARPRAGHRPWRHLPVEARALRGASRGRSHGCRSAPDRRQAAVTEPRAAAASVLVVDDAEDLRQLISIALGRGGFDVLEADSGEAALAIIESRGVDVVVLDMGLPVMSGTDVVRALRARRETLTLPILLMTGSGTSQSVIEGLDAGADDFLAKPVRLDELVARVRAHLRSQAAWSRLVADELRVRASVVAALGHMTLSTEPEAAAEAVVNEIAKRTEAPFISVLQLVSGGHLQPLATYSRSLGTSRGGVVLQPGRSANLLGKAARGPWAEPVPDPEPGESDNLFFSVDMALVAGAPIYAGETLVGVLNIGGASQSAAPSLGEQAKLMAAAIDYASILTAVAGPALADRRETVEIRARLKRDLAAHAFHSVFQPIVTLENRQVVGFEALTRFSDGTPPNLRFAAAAAMGLGDDYEVAALESALAESPKLSAGSFLTMNVSPAVVLRAGPRLRRLLAGASRPIVLELTEHVAIDDYTDLRNAIAALGEVEIAVDDAGAGYASMRHILEIRPAFAKLDISLVRGIDSDELRQAMAAGFQYYALRTGCRLIAEGVETEAEAASLRALGVDLGQGYLFGRPAPLSA